MAELPLTDAEADALSGATDAELDLTYPTIGQSPYHTTLYRLLERLASLARTTAALRVYRDGALTFGVRPGRAGGAAAIYAYAGAAAQPLTDNATNSIYLTVSGGQLQLAVSTGGLPDPAATPHVPLATIDTGTASIAGVSGAYAAADITDLRAAAMLRVVGA
ncbi:MAG: hypothetical protein GX591_16635 [Planctomycetes bacterium]|nr:hypothetical protein [Planctomycetota bacterium]